MKELASLSDEIAKWKVLLQARDNEVATLRTEAHKRKEELQDKGDRIVHLENDILTKDVLIDALTEDKTSQKVNSYTKVGVLDEIISDLSCTVSLD